MNRQLAKNALLLLGAVVVFVVLFVNSRNINEETNNKYSGDIRQLESAHAVLNEDLLRAKLGLLTYYDPLNQTLSSIDQLRSALGNVPSFISAQGQDAIRQSLKVYDDTLAQQRGLVENFKTQNAVLRNSLSYFTIVVSDLTAKAAGTDVDPTTTGTLNSLYQDVLLYNTTADKSLVARIQQELDAVNQNQSKLSSGNGPVQVDLQALTGHTNIVVKRKPIIDSVIDQIFALPISEQISEISHLYESSYEIARQNANFFQIALYLFSLIVLGYIAVAIIVSLRKSSSVVSNAKEALQITNNNLEKRTTELELATQEAYEASRLKDEFLATMSHELRTPLNAIIGFQGILLMSTKLDERATHMIQRTQANSERLLALINDILDISRIESGRVQFAPEPLNIAQAVERWRSQMSILADQKGLNFLVTIDESMPEIVYADEDAITKIVTNLLGNAFKFTEKGEVGLNLKRANGHWIIGVSDTGIGVPVHMQQIIFERFRQVDGSSKRKYGGSGLGLAIVYKLCQAMNGTVTVQSIPDEGSTFTVTLPLKASSLERLPHATN